eukprot:CAMPEP_0185494190 /NCGR_PEP_ID=MMETSP1366-20130426/16672_1 /TAXON_ID=38817 /ORGANISM="Gephyrocapsa oceanica, Strain RCC1303" /LENGTH=176 /DNA_ID=CAMNT_0028103127 /DNA_START=328 /DNA_END=854 /DNA_ORIENTATION=+
MHAVAGIHLLAVTRDARLEAPIAQPVPGDALRVAGGPDDIADTRWADVVAGEGGEEIVATAALLEGAGVHGDFSITERVKEVGVLTLKTCRPESARPQCAGRSPAANASLLGTASKAMALAAPAHGVGLHSIILRRETGVTPRTTLSSASRRSTCTRGMGQNDFACSCRSRATRPG